MDCSRFFGCTNGYVISRPLLSPLLPSVLDETKGILPRYQKCSGSEHPMAMYRCSSIFMTFYVYAKVVSLKRQDLKRNIFHPYFKGKFKLKTLRKKIQKAHCKKALPHVETEIRRIIKLTPTHANHVRTKT